MVAARPAGGGRRSVRASAAVQIERFRSRLWPVPALAVVVAVVVGIVLTRVDLAFDGSMAPVVRTLTFEGDADTARSVLSAIAGAIVTATSLTFSLTVVAFQLASSQASPRLLRTFAKDGKVHATLAVFLGTFAYALTVLRTVSGGSATTPELVPRLSITLGFLLALVSIVTLVLFLAHLASQLRIETMLTEAHDDAVEAADVVQHAEETESASDEAVRMPEDAHLLLADRSGFISGVDRAELLEIATREDLRIVELHRVGAQIVQELPFLRIDRPVADEVASRLRAAYDIETERTAGQDYLFGMQQIVDVGVRALSPGVNDPTSAVHAIGHLSSLLVRLRRLPPCPLSIADPEGVPRLQPTRSSWSDALRLAVTEIRRYGAGDLEAATRLYGLLRENATVANTESARAALREQLDLLDGSAADADYAPSERDRFGALSDTVRDHLDRD